MPQSQITGKPMSHEEETHNTNKGMGLSTSPVGWTSESMTVLTSRLIY